MMDLFGLPWPLAITSMATGAGLMVYGVVKATKAEREWDAMEGQRLGCGCRRLFNRVDCPTHKPCCGRWGGRGCPSCYEVKP